MSGFLIDTNVVSEFVKPDPNPNVRLWFQLADPNLLLASVVTLGEIRLRIENLPPGKRRTDLETWLTSGLPEWFAANLLPVHQGNCGSLGASGHSIQTQRNNTGHHGWIACRNGAGTRSYLSNPKRKGFCRFRRSAFQSLGLVIEALCSRVSSSGHVIQTFRKVLIF